VKFLFVSDFKPDRDSGAAGSLMSIGGALDTSGHEVDFEWHDSRPYRTRHAALQRLIELPRRQLHQVRTRLDRERYDAVIVSQPYAYLVYESLAQRHPNTLFLNRTHGWEARLYAAHDRFRWDGPLSRKARMAHQIGALLTRRACRRTALSCQGVITPSSRCADFIRVRYALPDDSVVTIPYGLDDRFLRLPDRMESDSESPRLLYVGNYLPLKGTGVLETVLPDLAPRHPEVSLTCVVDPAAVDLVEQHYRPAFRERLTVVSWIDRERLPDIYARNDIFLCPSLFEGFGKAWLEAMAAGLCVVGFAEGGLADVARNEAEALYCEAGDVATFASMLERAVAEPQLVSSMGRRARQRARELTWARTAQRTVDYCERRAAAR